LLAGFQIRKAGVDFVLPEQVAIIDPGCCVFLFRLKCQGLGFASNKMQSMATDALASRGGTLCALDDDTITALDAVLPGTWPRRNPIDIIGDAPVDRYLAALGAVLADKTPQTILLIYAPTAIVDSAEIARAVVPVIRNAPRTVLTCWMGGASVAEARRICADAGVAAFDTPEEAVAAHLQIATYRQNQEILMETPASVPEDFSVNATAARVIIDEAIAAGREVLTEPEAKAVFSAYGLPVVETRIARDPEHDHAVSRAHKILCDLIKLA